MNKINIVIDQVEKEKLNKATRESYRISGLPKGFGHTIGNALRRVIIAYTPGLAVTNFQTDCFQHEFDKSEDVIEEVSEIMMNFKDLILEYDENFGDEPKEILVNVKGPYTVKGADIEKDGIKVINKDVVLFNLSSEKDFEFKVIVQKGCGFVIHSSNHKENDSSIGITSVYSRIDVITYEVETDQLITDQDSIIVTFEHQNIYKNRLVLDSAIAKLKEIVELLDVSLGNISVSEEEQEDAVALVRAEFEVDLSAYLALERKVKKSELYDIIFERSYKEFEIKKSQFTKILNFLKK